MEPEILSLLEQANGSARFLRRGDVLFHEGNRGNSFYVVKSGRLRAIRHLDGANPSTIGEIGRGEMVGEMAVLGDAPRAASVIAIRDSHVVEFSGTDLTKLSKESLLSVMRILALRIRRMIDSRQVNSLPSCITVVPVSASAPMAEYCERLAASLKEAGGHAALVRPADLPAEFASVENCDGELFHRLGGWLDELERREKLIVLQADYEVTPWTERCLRQADLILLVARASEEPSKSPAERAIDRLPGKQARPRVDLVLLQEEPPYHGTARWLADRDVVRHHHVRLHSTADRARAGRMLTGRDVTLAFGGGGARGFAHIGVIRACQELGIPIDRVCGTSMGSIIAGLYAMGMDWNGMTEHLRSHFLPKRRLSQYTFPILSIDTARNYEKALRRLYGTTEIEDLPVNYFCVSCNLTTASVVIHRSGSLAKWIGASISVPGIAPPYVERGELLVDGGLLNNLPVDIAKADGAGMAIAVDVSPETEFRLPSTYSGRPQALEVLWSRITRKSRESQGFEHKPVHPTLGALLVRATTLTSVNQKDLLAKIADLYLKLPVEGFKLLDFDKLDSISEIGYTASMSELLGVVKWIQQSPAGNQP
jgi:NTE family protein/lysophospholipid hydrolase